MPFQTPWAAEIQGQRSPRSLLYSQNGLFASSSENKPIWASLCSGPKTHFVLFFSSVMCHFLCSYDYIRLTYWFFCFICQTAEDTISTIIRLFGFSRRFLSAEPIFHSKIFKQPSKSWSRDDQAWMCPGWLRASSAARCPRRAAAITCLRIWRWSRRRRSSSCCCSSSSWPCSSYAVFASCWTRTAACPHPTGQTTLRRTRLITALSEESCGCTNWRKEIRNKKKLIWC